MQCIQLFLGNVVDNWYPAITFDHLMSRCLGESRYTLTVETWMDFRTSRSKVAKIQEYRLQSSGLLESLTSVFDLYEPSKTM